MPHGCARALFEQNIHPRIFFGPEDIPFLRQKAKQGAPGRALAEILRRAKRYGDPASPHVLDPSADLKSLLAKTGEWPREGYGLPQALHCMSFAYAFTGEKAWAEKAIRLIRVITGSPEASGGFTTAALEGELPLAVDLVWDAMTDADRARAETFLRDQVMKPYRQQTLERLSAYVWGLGTNLFLHPFLPYLLALATVYRPEQDREAMEQAVSLIRRGLHLGADEGGAIFEGPSYGWTDAITWSFSAEIFHRAGAADLWTDEPRLANLSRYWTYLILPGGRGQNTPGDAWRYAGRRPFIHFLLATWRLNDPARQWSWERMGGRGAVEKIVAATDCFSSHLGHVVLWEKDAAADRTTGDFQCPAAWRSGSAGVVVMRSGWKDEDLYFSLLASGRTPGCAIHQHLDGGHFCLFALNEAFSIDTGYGDIMARYHSVMIPGGEEPSCSPDDFDSVQPGGRVTAFAGGKQADYACVEVTTQWGCRWAFRHALLIRGPGADPYVAIFDNFNYRSRFFHYLWLMNSEPGNQISVDQIQERATVRGRRHRLEVGWSFPRAEDYHPQHRIELETDVIDSFPLSHRKQDIDYFHGLPGQARPLGGGRWGAGLRPRLKTTLWGWNGQLLTVLAPRREGQAPVSFKRLSSRGHFGIEVGLGDCTDTIVASPDDRWVDLGGMRGEASLAVARRDARGKLLWWAAADVFSLTVDGIQVARPRGNAATLLESE